MEELKVSLDEVLLIPCYSGSPLLTPLSLLTGKGEGVIRRRDCIESATLATGTTRQ